jgi:hypothetical protein
VMEWYERKRDLHGFSPAVREIVFAFLLSELNGDLRSFSSVVVEVESVKAERRLMNRQSLG